MSDPDLDCDVTRAEFRELRREARMGLAQIARVLKWIDRQGEAMDGERCGCEQRGDRTFRCQYHQGVEDERQATLGWLRSQYDRDEKGACTGCAGTGWVDLDNQGIDQMCPDCCGPYADIIDHIEKGEHQR